ncbi:MAG: ATP-binding cassette domain-containing protein [Acetobacteraceae bacterium]|nr:ATP-binding cassette domain-containing protein [Acetobacteraceae bacterium]
MPPGAAPPAAPGGDGPEPRPLPRSGRPPVIQARGLRLALDGRTIVDVPELEVRQGEVLGIMGPNGAGKSTLLRLLALLQRPTAGEVRIDGRRPRTRAEVLAARRLMAMVFQEPLLLSGTVYFNVALGLRLRGLPEAAVRSRAPDWIERLGLGPLARRNVRTLSAGEAQRAALARAFALQPRVLFLDEPFAALDSPTRAALAGELQAILAATGTTAVFVGHDPVEVRRVSHRVVEMEGGRLRGD